MLLTDFAYLFFIFTAICLRCILLVLAFNSYKNACLASLKFLSSFVCFSAISFLYCYSWLFEWLIGRKEEIRNSSCYKRDIRTEEF